LTRQRRTVGFGVLALLAVLAMPACSADPTAGFWFEDDSFELSAGARSQLGGALTNEEMSTIKTLSRLEVERAFARLAVAVTPRRDAFWRVAVRQTLPVKRNQKFPNAGESLALGMFGGRGGVNFDFVVIEALDHAPAGAPRQTIVEGIGRGVGRVAVHEFMHQVLGAAAPHNYDDSDSYEHGSPERRSQYYGELRWTTAWPLLQRRLGVKPELQASYH
jgi:hypothetical protein